MKEAELRQSKKSRHDLSKDNLSGCRGKSGRNDKKWDYIVKQELTR